MKIKNKIISLVILLILININFVFASANCLIDQVHQNGGWDHSGNDAQNVYDFDYSESWSGDFEKYSIYPEHVVFLHELTCNCYLIT